MLQGVLKQIGNVPPFERLATEPRLSHEDLPRVNIVEGVLEFFSALARLRSRDTQGGDVAQCWKKTPAPAASGYHPAQAGKERVACPGVAALPPRAPRRRARGTRGGRHVSGSRRAGGYRLSRPCSG